MSGYRGVVGLTVALLILTACGGSGSGSGDSGNPPPPATDWRPGLFLPEGTFASRCTEPRSGIDPATGLPYPDISGMVLDENNFLRSWSNRTYLWYDEILDQDPGLFEDPIAYFDVLKTNATTTSGAPKDKFHFTYDSEEWFLLSQGGVSAGYGAEWAVLSAIPPRRIVVAFTEENTPATLNGLVRGARVLAVDNVDINDPTQAGIDALNAGLFPSAVGQTHTFQIEDPDRAIRNITMTSQEIQSATVQNVEVINTTTGVIGYLTFNYHRAPAERELIDAVSTLNAGQGIDDLVLDLRYNGGGFLAIASQLAYMIAGPGNTGGRTFDTLQFNDKYPSTNPMTGGPIVPMPFFDQTLGFSVSEGQPLPTLNLSRVYVLTGPNTCSASEAVINGLRGIGVEVIQIGSRTCGKPYGFYPEDNCGTTYFTIQFRGVNEVDYGDYSDGFWPSATDNGRDAILGCQVADDFSRQLGDPTENMLEVALSFRSGEGCVTPASTVASEFIESVPALRSRYPALHRSPFDSNRIMDRR